MKLPNLKDEKTRVKILTILLFAASLACLLIFIFTAGKQLFSTPDEPPPGEQETTIPITGDSNFASKEMLSPTVVSYKGESGLTYQIGFKDSISIPNKGDAIPLSPVCSDTSIKVGFFFDVNIGSIVSEYTDVDVATSEQSTFWISQWTGDYVYGAAYQSEEDYGVAWVVDERAIESLSTNPDAEKKITVRTIDLTHCRFLDSFNIFIALDDEGKCTFSRTESADISVTNSNLDRNWLIETALLSFNDDGWAIGTTTKADGTKVNEYYNQYEAIPTADRYVVEMLDEMTYSPYILNRGEQSDPIYAIGPGEDSFPMIAVTPCYDIANAKSGLYTIYLYPAFLYGSGGATYLGYSDWNNPDCSPEISRF